MNEYLAISTLLNWALVYAFLSIVPELSEVPEIEGRPLWLPCLPFAVLAAWGTVLLIQQIFVH